MFKKISVFLVLVLVITALSACASGGLAKLSDKKKEDIAWARLVYHYTIDIVELGNGKNVYLGEYNGYPAIYLDGWGYYSYQNGELVGLSKEDRVVLRGVLAGDTEIDSNYAGFCASQKAEIEKLWLDKSLSLYKNPEDYQGHWSDDDPKGECHYFGSFNGYDIIFWTAGGADVISSVTIAGETFTYGNPFQLIGYRDGIVYGLEELYKNGKVSDKSIQTIAQLHKERVSGLYN